MTKSKLKAWAGSICLCLAIAAGANADEAASTSNDPTAPMDSYLTALFGREHSALAAVTDTRLGVIVASRPPVAEAASTMVYDEVWLAGQPDATGDAEFECLAKALYFEARGETIMGQAAVAEVVLNRVGHPAFPKTICGVVRQGSGGSCQFSWACDGASDDPADAVAWQRSAKIARAMIDGAPRTLTDGAIYFHARGVRPAWSRKFRLTTEIGSHFFYRTTG